MYWSLVLDLYTLDWPVRRADNLATFMCRLSWNRGASTSWNPQGLSRPVMGLLYLYLYLYLALLTSPCVTRQFCCWVQRLTHGTGYKHIWPLCQKHVTKPVNYPATPCILLHFCCNFRCWSPGRETARQCDNKATRNPTALGVRSQSYPTTPTHPWVRDQDIAGCWLCMYTSRSALHSLSTLFRRQTFWPRQVLS
jgi:hypothetical protein